MEVIHHWEDAVKKYLAETRGWEDGKNCTIECETVVNISDDKVTYNVKVRPFEKVEVITVNLDFGEDIEQP